MLSQNRIKFLRSLELKKNRIKERKIVLDGRRLINEAINHNTDIEHIWIDESLKVNESDIDTLIKKIKSKGMDFSFESRKDIDRISNTVNSQGIIALMSIDGFYNDSLKDFDERIVILDRISDPGNLGTIIRTCAWFGVKSIILSENSADVFNYKCVRSSVGGHFLIRNLAYFSYDSINEFLSSKNMEVLSAGLDGDVMSEIRLPSKWGLILGSEAHGVTGNVKANRKVTIANEGKMESLNVSVAAGILLNELTRQ